MAEARRCTQCDEVATTVDLFGQPSCDECEHRTLMEWTCAACDAELTPEEASVIVRNGWGEERRYCLSCTLSRGHRF